MLGYVRTILKDYDQIMQNEAKLSNKSWSLSNLELEKMYGITVQLLETVLSSRVLRSFYPVYDLSEDEFAKESVGAHTNLMVTLADRAFSAEYSRNPRVVPLERNYRALMEAARRHDLPENVIGDIPDNGNRDDKKKALEEAKYFEEYSELTVDYDKAFEEKVNELLISMAKKDTKEGRLLYMSDKTAAILIVLAEDLAGNSPKMYWKSPKASENDRKNMEYCDYHENGSFKASEMWTVSFFVTREMSKFDDTGFFTAIIVIATLLVNHKWYDWRKNQYKEYLN